MLAAIFKITPFRSGLQKGRPLPKLGGNFNEVQRQLSQSPFIEIQFPKQTTKLTKMNIFTLGVIVNEVQLPS